MEINIGRFLKRNGRSMKGMEGLMEVDMENKWEFNVIYKVEEILNRLKRDKLKQVW